MEPEENPNKIDYFAGRTSNEIFQIRAKQIALAEVESKEDLREIATLHFYETVLLRQFIGTLLLGGISNEPSARNLPED